MGRSIEDVDALVLTHGHSDHIGFAERVRADHGVPVSVHELDATLARGEVDNPSAGLGDRSLGAFFGFMLWSMRKGALRIKNLTEVSTFGDGATLDVPGSPRLIETPGHTAGSVSLVFEGVDALLTGDAIATLAVTTGADGPRIAPFAADPAQALASLDRLADVEATWVLPGHGHPWDGGAGEAVSRARAAGIDGLATPTS